MLPRLLECDALLLVQLLDDCSDLRLVILNLMEGFFINIKVSRDNNSITVDSMAVGQQQQGAVSECVSE